MKEYCVSCARMKILERNTDAAGLSYYQMMENAGTIAANRIVEITITSPINYTKGEGPEAVPEGNGATYMYQLGRAPRVRVYCGKGNNGGDGFVVARKLHQLAWDVEIILVDGEPSTEDAIENRKLAGQRQIPILEMSEELSGHIEEYKADIIVDAMYGTGFHGKLRENGAAAAALIDRERRRGARVFALDIPSGMGGDLTDRSELDPRAVRADVTIAFHAKKPAQLQDFAEEFCGRIITADIGIVDPEQGA